MNDSAQRIDLEIISSLVRAGSRVLDVGSGDGALLSLLQEQAQVRGVGIELSGEGVKACMVRGLNVIQGDAETELQNYPDLAFDYVILSHTIQAMHQPADIMRQMLRIGKAAIVSFPNFGYWQVRLYLLFRGRMPISSLLPHRWFNTPNLHLCTIKDFVALTEAMDLDIKDFLTLTKKNRPQKKKWHGWHLGRANWFAQQAIFVLESKKGDPQ